MMCEVKRSLISRECVAAMQAARNNIIVTRIMTSIVRDSMQIGTICGLGLHGILL